MTPCWCYLAEVPAVRKAKVKAALLANPAVTRVTDHGGHIKVVARRAPVVAGVVFYRVRDQTTHWDAWYWDVAMQIARHARTKRQPSSRAIGVLMHYLCNLTGEPEARLLGYLAVGRDYLDHAMTDEQAHGWEFRALAKAKREAKRRAHR